MWSIAFCSRCFCNVSSSVKHCWDRYYIKIKVAPFHLYSCVLWSFKGVNKLSMCGVNESFPKNNFSWLQQNYWKYRKRAGLRAVAQGDIPTPWENLQMRDFLRLMKAQRGRNVSRQNNRLPFSHLWGPWHNVTGYPKFNGSHFGLPSTPIYSLMMTAWLGDKIAYLMFAHMPPRIAKHNTWYQSLNLGRDKFDTPLRVILQLHFCPKFAEPGSDNRLSSYTVKEVTLAKNFVLFCPKPFVWNLISYFQIDQKK